MKTLHASKTCDQQQEEDLEHFILICPAYQEQRMRTRKLQQPYQEDKINVIGKVLFEKEGIEEKKDILYNVWKIRQRKIEEL